MRGVLKYLRPKPFSKSITAPRTMASVGVDRMEGMTEVATRMNHSIFKDASQGSPVRMGGRLSNINSNSAGVLQLTTTDGGVINVTGLDEWNGEVPTTFMEVVGKKTGDSELQACGAISLGDSVDAELWDEAVKMMHIQACRNFFEPIEA